MLPDIRFAIGAVLASALLITTAFGLAATVRIAHHKTAGPLEAPRVLAYDDPIDWGPRPDALRRLEELRINDPLLDRLAAIPVEPAAIMRGDIATERAHDMARDPVVIALPVEAVLAVVVAAETPNTAGPAAAVEMPAIPALPVPIAEAPAVAAPIAVVAEIPSAQIIETRLLETERAAPARTTILLAAIEVAAKSDPHAATLRLAVPIKKAAPAVKKKVAKVRRPAKRIVARQPTASTGYPVTGSSNPFGNSGFGNGSFSFKNSFGKNSFDTNKYFGSD